MEIIVSILAFFGLLLLLKYFGKGLILIVAFIVMPFYAVYQLLTGKAENRRNALIIAISGIITLLCIFVITMLSNI